MGNLLHNPQVGILFVDFTSPKRLRVNGIATIAEDDPLLASYPEAQFVVRVRATHVLPNCPRYVHRMEIVERSRFVPHEACETPVPDWKRRSWSRDVLPAETRRTTPNRWIERGAGGCPPPRDCRQGVITLTYASLLPNCLTPVGGRQ